MDDFSLDIELYQQETTTWDSFSPEVAWYIYDCFRFELAPYEKLIFYSYFINGMTLMEIAESADCTFQHIGYAIKNIEKRLRSTWVNKSKWKVGEHDDQREPEPVSAGNKKGSKH